MTPIDLSKYTPPVRHLLQFFDYAHLPPHLQAISKPFAALAIEVAESSSNPETTVALRKLLEAKDAAVRGVIADRLQEQRGPIIER